MAHILLRRKAIELRMLGRSYGQIRKQVKVSKSTLSEWLRRLPLTEEQLQKIKSDNEEYRIEQYRKTMLSKRVEKLRKYYEEQKSLLIPLSERELLIAGVFLYWGEGTKVTKGQFVIANTDPSLVQFSLLWMTKALGIPKEKIHVLVHLYKYMNIEASLNYWSKLLNVPRSQFSKPYVKASNRSSIDYRSYGHGTCNLRVYDTVIKEKILMAIKAIGDYSAAQIQNV